MGSRGGCQRAAKGLVTVEGLSTKLFLNDQTSRDLQGHVLLHVDVCVRVLCGNPSILHFITVCNASTLFVLVSVVKLSSSTEQCSWEPLATCEG
jgi:hypothetical protein